jgi:hypothetical protein
LRRTDRVHCVLQTAKCDRFPSLARRKARVADLIFREKTDGLSDDEKSELDLCLQVEHLLRVSKVRAHHYPAGVQRDMRPLDSEIINFRRREEAAAHARAEILRLAQGIYKGDTRARLYEPHLNDAPFIVSFMSPAELRRWALELVGGESRRQELEDYLTRYLILHSDDQMCGR